MGLSPQVAAGDAIVLAASGNFLNPGAFALNPGTGRFLVWSTNPAFDNRGGLAYNFKQYGAVFGDAVLGTGNGFLYSVAPVITPSLGGSANRGYDGTALAPTGSLSVSGTGAIDGDTVTFSLAGAAYSDKHAGTNKPVTANGIGIASATNGAATVYGYQLAGTTASSQHRHHYSGAARGYCRPDPGGTAHGYRRPDPGRCACGD